MNVLSKDTQTPPPEIAELDIQNILDTEKSNPLPTKEGNIDFANALANVIKLEDTPKSKNVVASDPVKIDLKAEYKTVVVRAENFFPSQVLTEHNDGSLQEGVAVVKIDGKISPEIRLLTNQTNNDYSKLDQPIHLQKESLISSASNIPLRTTKSDLIKNIASGFDDTQILAPIRLASNKDMIFVDIGSIQKKILPNRNNTISAFPLLPTRDFTGANTNLPSIVPHDLLFAPLGESNSLQQTQMSIQMPAQIPTQISSLANSVVMQVREPILEQLGAAHETLRDQGYHKPKDIIVQLSPAELGRIQIRFSFDAGERVVAQLVAENSETMAVLRQKSALLMAQLKLGGFENIDLSFETVGQRNFSGQNSGAEFFKGQNGQSEPNFWPPGKGDPKSDNQQLGKDDTHFQVRNHMHTQSSQIDIIL